MSLNFKNNQIDKKTSQAKSKVNYRKQVSKAKKSFEKMRKKNRKKAIMDNAKSLTSPQIELMLLPSQMSRACKKKKRRLEILARSSVIATIKRAILPLTI